MPQNEGKLTLPEVRRKLSMAAGGDVVATASVKVIQSYPRT